ncbi:hypothetical protein [Nostoc sp. PA-18-2419]|uniref:hypothetical protein n=1 Tax=Nostoc sp. PA-18-2419 TaxID=2575443 RepID=UPI00110980BF|nr:hypothetical protein [Nostoc sp. PA-18-2419]
MNFTVYFCSVSIVATANSVANFLCLVPNLPRWTKFFLQVGSANQGRYAVQTKFGEATTWIEQVQTEAGKQLIINSLIGNRLESAYINLTGENDNTQVTFEIRLPANWTFEQIESQLDQLQQELYQLKALVEIEYGLAQVSREINKQERLLALSENRLNPTLLA